MDAAAGSTPRTIAAFDFDGTLTRRDTLGPFLASLVGWSTLLRGAGRQAPDLVRAALGRGDRDAAKESLLVRLLAGRAYDDVHAAGVAFGRQVARRGIRPDTWERVVWHRARGHETVIVSASLDAYLDTVGELLGFEAVLCTRLEVDADGRCTGRLLDGNCRGEAKATRLRAHLGDVPCTVWAYGDSAGDDAMLAMADHPVRVARARARRPRSGRDEAPGEPDGVADQTGGTAVEGRVAEGEDPAVAREQQVAASRRGRHHRDDG